MDLQNIFLSAAMIVNFIFGLLIYLQGRSKKRNIIFVFLAISVSIWTFAMVGYRSYDNTLAWCRFLYAAAILIPLSFLYLNYLFPERKRVGTYVFILISLPALFLIFLTIFTNFIIIDAFKVMGKENKIIFGNLYAFYVIYIFGYFSWSFIILLINHKKYLGIIRMQERYLLIGTILSSGIAMTTNLILPWFNYFSLNWLGQVVSPLWIIFTFYAMFRYRLMDIRIIARKTVMYLFAAIFVFAIFYLISWIYNKFFGSIYNKEAYISGLIISPLFVVVFVWINKWIKLLANKYLFFNLYNQQEAINNLIKRLNRFNSLEDIVSIVINTIKQTMEIDRAAIITVNQSTESINYKVAITTGFGKKDCINLIQNDFLKRYLERTQESLIIEELSILVAEFDGENKEMFLKLEKNMKAIEVSLCLPLVSNKKLIGIIILGLKPSGQAYSKEELDLLDALSFQVGIAIDNALLYKNIEENNKYLHELVNIKDDFIRIANHQLNTPLSIMRNAYYMIKDGSLEVKNGLIYLGNGIERMSQILKDFWDTFQLETEDIIILPKKTDIKKIIKNMIKEKKELLVLPMEKNIKIHLEKTSSNIPFVWCDPQKITHAISNLIDNAISYTPKGTITVSYEIVKNGQYLKINIRDTGIGISSEEKIELCHKFYRSKKAISMHPDGSGLGLYISKRIVESGKGELTFSSDGEGKGSTFSFTVPIYKTSVTY